MEFKNVYEDSKRADAYSKLEFPGTYFLAYRDLPDLIFEHFKNGKALDFGCGTGRSTRFLKKLGFDTVGIDISDEMICKAKSLDPEGKYILVEDDDFSELGIGEFDIILSIFTFDNIPGKERRVELLRKLNSLLHSNGIMILLDSTPELYLNDWSSFITTVFEENKKAVSGQIVKTIMKDVEDRRPVEDVLWIDEDYRECFKESGFNLIKTHKPLGKPEEPCNWTNETIIAPWIIYVIKNKYTRNKLNEKNMVIKMHPGAKGKIAEIISDEIIINKTQDALDLMADVDSQDSKKIILYKGSISPDFFNLKTGLAGEILQKFVNYHTRLSIVGDFSKHSKNFNAFMLECNRGNQFLFVSNLNEAITKFESN